MSGGAIAQSLQVTSNQMLSLVELLASEFSVLRGEFWPERSTVLEKSVLKQATTGPHSPGFSLPRALASLTTLLCVAEIEVRDVTPGTTASTWPAIEL